MNYLWIILLKEKQMSSKEENPLHALIRLGLPIGMKQLHIVAFSFLNNVSKEFQEVLMTECRELFENCGGREAGIISFDTIKNIDQRKGFDWVEIAVFENAEAFIGFHAHPKHQAFAERIATFADKWIVIDLPIQVDSQIKF